MDTTFIALVRINIPDGVVDLFDLCNGFQHLSVPISRCSMNLPNDGSVVKAHVQGEGWNIKVGFDGHIADAFTDIVCDTREPQHIREGFTTILPLYGGDYFWLSRASRKPVLVERKQLSNGELMSALFMNPNKGIVESKLNTQVRKMASLPYSEKILLIELGDYEVDSWTGKIEVAGWDAHFKWSAVQKGLRSLFQMWHIYPWYGPGNGLTHSSIKAIYEHTNKVGSSQRSINFDPGLTVPKHGESISNPVQALCCTDGIGPEVAKAILNRFISLSGVANATLDDLQDIPGVGLKKAEAIHN